MKKILKSKLIFVVAFLIFSSVGIGYIVSKLYFTYQQLSVQKQMSLVAINITNHINTEINSIATVTYILASLLKNNNYKTDKFEQWAKELYIKFPYLANMQLAKDGVVSHIYPLQGHEAAMGHDLLNDKQRVKGAKIAITSKTLTLVGPLKLIQNNKLAVIGRLPIFNADNEDSFWGFATAIAYLEPLLKKGLDEIDNAGFNYRLEGNNPDATKKPIFASSIDTQVDNASSFMIEVPNGTWTMILSPKKALNSYLLEFEAFFVFIGVLLSFFYVKYENRLSLILQYENKIEEQRKYEISLKERNEELKKLYEDLDKQRLKYKSLLRNASDEIFILNEKGQLLEYSEKTREILGYSDDEMKNLNVFDWDLTINEEKLKNFMFDLQERPIVFETKHWKKDGTTYIASITANKISYKNESLIYCTVRDITKEKEIKQKLLEERDFVQLLVDNSTMLLLTDGVGAFYANKSLLEFFACESFDTFKNRYSCICDEFIQNQYYFYIDDIAERTKWIDYLLKLPMDKRIVSMISKQNFEPMVFNLGISVLDGKYLISFNDISDRMHKEISLEEKILHDGLTKAFSREYFWKNIQAIAQNYFAMQKQVAISILDIDFFKKVNDTYGHDVGDNVLVELVKLIKQNLRTDDFLIRWGGEEFVLILSIKDEESLYVVLENLRNKIATAQFKDIGELTCSFGGTIFKNDENIETTLKRADIALYKSKNSGRNKVTLLFS